ncbi:DNA polymerase [Acidovorax sp. Root267]|uniref:reverse transcriptase family protein n=1 Tax=Acidovorax sp. Root267 TaxID=1736505 RepID=UPI00071047E0|nr:reverse transcriptase family protein [Acidovorax sp. Root267]KRD21359.1 DNA polymerase [Acidovorax sp. Root267]
MKKISARTRALAKALAMAVLADAREPERHTLQALSARAGACLGGSTTPADSPDPLPAPLFEQLRRLSNMSDPEWARLEPEDVATWLCWGIWWRKAGVRNGSALQALTANCGQDAEEQDAWDDLADGGDEDAEPALPVHQWPDSQLARAFRTWAANVRAGETLHWLLRPAAAGPHPAWKGRDSTAPVLATATDVTEALAISLGDLLWLAPEHAHWRERQNGAHALPLSHYRYRLLPKPSGGLRLLEAPRPRLASTQRRILDSLLAGVPVHEAAHDFVRGRSVGSHAQVHTHQAVVIRFDLADFFTSITATRVRALWRALGHGRPAAELLTRLTTTRTPQAVRDRLLEATSIPPEAIAQRHTIGARLKQPHLPQGAPTSPALANLCAFGLDLRLHALAEHFGARYTRYADDLVFSGPKALLHRQWVDFRAWVTAIAQDEGFTLRADKTRVIPAHQRQYVTGLVVNQRTNYSRTQFDTLKARLHRLAQQPPVNISERARLAGEIQWASQWLAPTRSAKLQRLLHAIRSSNEA